VLSLYGQHFSCLLPSRHNGLFLPNAPFSESVVCRDVDNRDWALRSWWWWFCGKGERVGREASQRLIKMQQQICQSDVATTEEKRSLVAYPAEICNSFGFGCLFFIRQIRNLNQNRVEGCRDVPLGLSLLPLGMRRKKSITSVSFPARSWPHQPADRIATAFRMTSTLVHPTELLE